MPGGAIPTARVATWNLWWRFGDPEARRPAITAQLQRIQPDIIGLQEVWGRESQHLAGDLGALLGLQVAYAPAPDSSHWQGKGGDDDTFHVGNAVLSRWPIEKLDAVVLPPGDAPDESRYALSAVVATPGGSMRFTTTHLNSGWWHHEIRRLQLATLLTWLADQPDCDLPMVLTGDLNAGPEADEIRPLRGQAEPYDRRLFLVDAWELANPDDPGFTWDRGNPHVPGVEPSSRIDYIFTGAQRLDGVGRVRSADTFGTTPVDGVMASDHHGVIAELQIAPS